MRESAAWRYLDAHLPPHVRVERVEVKHPPGLADCFWTDVLVRRSGWLELKFCEPGDREWKAGRIPKLRTAQPLWLNKQARNGVPSGLLLRVGTVHPVWKLWIASGLPPWSNMMNSVEARYRADVTWSHLEFKPSEVFRLLIQT